MQTNYQGERKNPYIAGNPIVDPSMFYGRQDVFNWIKTNIEGHTLVIHGQRRVGKTSVLHQLSRYLPSQYLAVYYDLQGRTSSSLELFLFGLAREISRVVKTQYELNLEELTRERFEYEPDYFERVFLPNIANLLPNAILLICLDEYDVMEDNSMRDQRGRALADLIRPLLGRRNINFIFSIGSSGRKLEYMKGSFTALFKTALYKKISFLRKEDTFKLITEPVQGVLNFGPDAMEYIYQITSGHPYYVQLICHELFSLFQKNGRPEVNIKDVESILDDVVERGTVNLKFIWDEASPLEKWCLASLAHLNCANRVSKELMDFMKVHEVVFTNHAVTSALLHLQEKEVLDYNNNFVIYLIDIWLRQNWTIDKVIETIGLLERTKLPHASVLVPYLIPRWAWLIGLITLVGVIVLAGWRIGTHTSSLATTQTAQALVALLPTARPVLPLSPTPAASKSTLAPTQTETPMTTATPIPTLTPALGIGSTKSSSKDGMVQIYVPAGEFLMGSDKAIDNQANDNELPQQRVYLNAFWIDKTEVTNTQYIQWCKVSGQCRPPQDYKSSTRSSYYENDQYANYPVINVDWNQARAYCTWAGRRLPTEAEWEKAARGTDGLIYSWGNSTPDKNKLNYLQNLGDTTAVGSYPVGASPYGVLDMAGNVWEWVNDWYSETYYLHLPSWNPAGPDLGNERVLRGGSWSSKGAYVRSANRSEYSPTFFGTFIGFRCASIP
jgi:formylglycine-generating enzyme required for sulfatase activity